MSSSSTAEEQQQQPPPSASVADEGTQNQQENEPTPTTSQSKDTHKNNNDEQEPHEEMLAGETDAFASCPKACPAAGGTTKKHFGWFLGKKMIGKKKDVSCLCPTLEFGNDTGGLGSWTNMVNRKAGTGKKVIKFVDQKTEDEARKKREDAAAAAVAAAATHTNVDMESLIPAGGDGAELGGGAPDGEEQMAFDFHVWWDDFKDNGHEIPQLVLTNAEKGVLFVVFLLAGIANSAPWTFYNTAIVYLVEKFPMGVNFIPIMNLTYTAMALPVLIFQSYADEKMDAMFGSRATYTFRFIVVDVLLASTLFVLPILSNDVAGQFIALGLSILLGIMDSAGFTSASQIFSILPSTAGAGFMLGASFSPVLALGFQSIYGWDPAAPSQASAEKTFFTAGALPLIGCGAMLYLIHCNRVGAALLMEKDAVASENAQQAEREKQAKAMQDAGEMTEISSAPTSPNTNKKEAEAAEKEKNTDEVKKNTGGDGDDENDENFDAASSTVGSEDSVSAKKMTNKELFMATIGCQGALFLGFFLTSLISGTAALMPSENDRPGYVDRALSSKVVYSMMFGSLIARWLILIPFKFIDTNKKVFILQLVNFLSNIFYFIYIFQANAVQAGEPTLFPLNDNIIIAFVGVSQLIKAYCGSSAFGISASVLPTAVDRSQAANILGLTLTVGMYIGIGMAFPVVALIAKVEDPIVNATTANVTV